MVNLLFAAAVAAYGGAAVLIVRNHLAQEERPSVLAWWLVAAGWLCQLVPLVQQLVVHQGRLMVNLAGSVDLVALAVALIYMVGWRLGRQEARSVGLILLPVVVATMLASRLLPGGEGEEWGLTDPYLVVHLLTSLGAYGLLSIAAILAVLDAFQEHALRKKHLGRLFTMFPPLGVLEQRLFFMVHTGFLLLTMSIASGAIFSHRNFGVYFTLSHKVVFSWATWVVFGVLLLGHQLQGWRGRRAVRFTLVGYALLVLAYMGVKFVYEVILQR